MGTLVRHFFETSDERNAASWLRRLLASGDTWEIGSVAGDVLVAHPQSAATWASLAAESGDAAVIGAVANSLDGTDDELAKSLREKLAQAS